MVMHLDQDEVFTNGHNDARLSTIEPQCVQRRAMSYEAQLERKVDYASLLKPGRELLINGERKGKKHD